MGIITLSKLVAVGVLSQAAPSPKAVLLEVETVAAKLSTKTERSAAFLALAQAQNHLGDHARALESLRLGWSAVEKGSDKGLSMGDAIDSHTLLDAGDFATLPVAYAYEFVVAGDTASARRSAMFLGSSDLADVYRQDLRQRLLARYPQAADLVSLTDAQHAHRAEQKRRLLAAVEKIRAKPDVSRRVGDLCTAARELATLNGRREGLALLREAAVLSDQIPDPAWRIGSKTQIATDFWQLDRRSEANDMMVQAEKEALAITDESKRLDARHSVEQAKRRMGLPNRLDEVIQAKDHLLGTPPVPPQLPAFSAPPAGGKSTPPNDFVVAERFRARGDLTSAKRALRRLRLASGEDHWWLVLASEMQIELGDRDGARKNLSEGSRRFTASLRPAVSIDYEEFRKLERIARAQNAVGDKAGAGQTLVEGIRRIAGGDRWAKIPHVGKEDNRMVVYDRRSPLLHAGAVALAKAGFYAKAVAIARTIPHPAHRAIALARAVRHGVSPTPAHRPG